jgi:hypothetical protein
MKPQPATFLSLNDRECQFTFVTRCRLQNIIPPKTTRIRRYSSHARRAGRQLSDADVEKTLRAVILSPRAATVRQAMA